MLKSLTRFTLFVGLSACLSTEHARGQVDFDRDVRPILADACFACHGPDAGARQAGLRLDTESGAFGARDGGPAIVRGESAKSLLVERITSTDPDEIMPPADATRRLQPEEIEILKRWIAEGAPWAKHWAFSPPRAASLPAPGNSAWGRNAIDAFVLARLEREELEPSPEADRATLIRRVTLDLTGLPPTPAAVDAFLADDAPGAYERVVDRVLSSPAYGERMAWEWLDASRYADSNGYQGDTERTMWPWRDWAVEALNAGMPFDRFTVEQLAGDLLPEAGPAQILATGFHRNHMINGEGGRIPEENRVEYVFDQTETTGTIWLGLTVGCARCHDHKFDPLTQREYYELYAFFNNTTVDGAGRSGQKAPTMEFHSAEVRARLDTLEHERRVATARVTAWEERYLRRQAPPIRAPAPAGAEATSSPLAETTPELLATLEKPVDGRDGKALELLEKQLGESHPEYGKRIAALRAAREAFANEHSAVPRVMVLSEREEPRETFILNRGTYNQPLDPVRAGVPAALPELPSGNAANRLGLARWLVSPEHPLTARVVVNRHWQHVFGTGLVKTVQDFGTQGEKPSHPELLDWLAVRFVESGWDLKKLHRLFVTSATYRQSSRATPERLARDPTNRLLARAPRFRLPSFVIRDQALALAGLLVPKLGGAPVKPYQPANIWAEATFNKKRYVQDHGEKLYRRSIYTFWRRIVGPTMFFDEASRQTCTVRAQRTNTPLHALITLNDITYTEAARCLAERTLLAAGEPSPAIELAFRLATARRPATEEIDVLKRRFGKLRSEFQDDHEAALAVVEVGEAPRSEELDLVEHAALSGLCSLILNLDEVITRE